MLDFGVIVQRPCPADKAKSEMNLGPRYQAHFLARIAHNDLKIGASRLATGPS